MFASNGWCCCKALRCTQVRALYPVLPESDEVDPPRAFHHPAHRDCRQVTKFYQLKTHLQGVSLQLMTMKSVDAMATAVKNTTRAMVRMNQR